MWERKPGAPEIRERERRDKTDAPPESLYFKAAGDGEADMGGGSFLGNVVGGLLGEPRERAHKDYGYRKGLKGDYNQ